MVGGLASSGTWEYASGKHIAGFWALEKMELYCPKEGRTDPIADEWERQVLCLMGVDADPRAEPKLDCPENELLKFSGLFQRSLGDEFGNAIREDISKLTASYGVIIVYCAFMLGKCDSVHSGVAMAFIAVAIVGMCIVSTLGLMGYFQVPNGNLNNNLYFLLLGLGVDDAFVLTSEFLTHSREAKEKGGSLSVPELIAKTARTGGISVLITSATDALAFLVGSTTVLPALSWFCTYAGVSIVLCYTFQLTVFLPCLALNARRTAASKMDCCCCFTRPERGLDDAQGCCCCCLPKSVFKGGVLKKGVDFHHLCRDFGRGHLWYYQNLQGLQTRVVYPRFLLCEHLLQHQPGLLLHRYAHHGELSAVRCLCHAEQPARGLWISQQLPAD